MKLYICILIGFSNLLYAQTKTNNQFAFDLEKVKMTEDEYGKGVNFVNEKICDKIPSNQRNSPIKSECYNVFTQKPGEPKPYVDLRLANVCESRSGKWHTDVSNDSAVKCLKDFKNKYYPVASKELTDRIAMCDHGIKQDTQAFDVCFNKLKEDLKEFEVKKAGTYCEEVTDAYVFCNGDKYVAAKDVTNSLTRVKKSLPNSDEDKPIKSDAKHK
jgi:hypothetical protein